VLSGSVYIDPWFLAKAPDAVPRTIATERATFVLANISYLPLFLLSIDFPYAQVIGEDGNYSRVSIPTGQRGHHHHHHQSPSCMKGARMTPENAGGRPA
jgi:hypothetical protein